MLGLTLAATIAAASTPRVVCGEQTAYVLGPGETLKKVALGIHIGTAEIQTPRGWLIIRDGHSWATRARFDEEVVLRSGVRIAMRREDGGAPRYAVFGPLDETKWGGQINRKEHLVAWIEGSALRGSHMDDSMLERIRIVPLDRSHCIFNLNYGWDQILLDEPPAATSQKD
ncbi:hypothetical protein [Sphingomonas jaspsi]|uniref:hypothetical protein n=1 Tax=Sphingomonas jaspsi TaxID=392409 RepID=UPI00055C58D9|nr:hypothetical protein [Sphingomonas jaspsi]